MSASQLALCVLPSYPASSRSRVCKLLLPAKWCRPRHVLRLFHPCATRHHLLLLLPIATARLSQHMRAWIARAVCPNPAPQSPLHISHSVSRNRHLSTTQLRRTNSNQAILVVPSSRWPPRDGLLAMASSWLSLWLWLRVHVRVRLRECTSITSARDLK